MLDRVGLSPEKNKMDFLIWGIYFLFLFWMDEGEKKENALQHNFHTSRQNTGAKVLYKETFLQLLLMSGFLITVVIVNIVGKYCSSYIN